MIVKRTVRHRYNSSHSIKKILYTFTWCLRCCCDLHTGVCDFVLGVIYSVLAAFCYRKMIVGKEFYRSPISVSPWVNLTTEVTILHPGPHILPCPLPLLRLPPASAASWPLLRFSKTSHIHISTSVRTFSA